MPHDPNDPLWPARYGGSPPIPPGQGTTLQIPRFGRITTLGGQTLGDAYRDMDDLPPEHCYRCKGAFGDAENEHTCHGHCRVEPLATPSPAIYDLTCSGCKAELKTKYERDTGACWTCIGTDAL